VNLVGVGAVNLRGVGAVRVVVGPHPCACVGRWSFGGGDAGGGGVSGAELEGTDVFGPLPPALPSPKPPLAAAPRLVVVGAGALEGGGT
jgi:hypothetical protein